MFHNHKVKHQHHLKKRENAREIGYPVVVRPSYVLGGRAMEIVDNDQEWKII